MSQHALRLVQQLQARAWISDLRQLGALPARDRQWLEDVWCPQLAASTISALALVLPGRRRDSTVPSPTVAADEASFCTQHFSCLAARQWISRLP